MRDFVRSLLFKAEDKGAAKKPLQKEIVIDMAKVESTMKEKATRFFIDRTGHVAFPGIGVPEIEVSSEGMKVKASITTEDQFLEGTERSSEFMVPKISMTVEVENHPSRPWDQEEFEERVSSAVESSCQTYVSIWSEYAYQILISGGTAEQQK